MGIILKSALFFAIGMLVLAAFLFIPAGTLDYWQAWLYLAVIFSMMLFVLFYFLKHDPDFLERRFKMREKEAKQKLFQKASGIVFFVAFLVPGLDRRFGWSNVPFEAVIAAEILGMLGYGLVFLVFRENSYAGRTIRVEKGQKVISTGPYSIIRHPMYLGASALYLATPIALGSYWAFLPFALIAPMLAYRIKNEEEVLCRDLKGYKAYMKKVKFRLVPGIW
ncbi:MAG: isoprenylcysteine carboxylmethyltransferase family protein [Candidatus Micrarchaeia archaeon]